MSSGFKFTVFSLIVVFAIATSQISVGTNRTKSTGPTKTSSAAVTTKTSTAGTSAGSSKKTTERVNANTSKTNVTGTISQIKVSNTRGQVLLKAPPVNSVTTVGALFDLINTNNASKTSNFIVFVPGSVPSSKSAGNFGLSLEYLKAVNSSGTPGILRNLQVTVKADDTGIIQLMQQRGAFPKSADITQALAYGWQAVFQYTIDNFPKILLYFQLPDLTSLPPSTQNAIPDSLKYNWKQKFYLIDPWPQTDPIKWNKGWAPEQTCRAYRLLMDWTFN